MTNIKGVIFESNLDHLKMAFTEYRIQVIFRSKFIYFEHKILKKNPEFQIDTCDSISDWSTISRPEFDWLIDHLTIDNMGHQSIRLKPWLLITI